LVRAQGELLGWPGKKKGKAEKRIGLLVFGTVEYLYRHRRAKTEAEAGTEVVDRREVKWRERETRSLFEGVTQR